VRAKFQVGWYRVCLLVFCLAALGLLAASAEPQVTVAQISDTHIGDKRAPNAADNLRQAVAMINERHPDVVILSGDIGENLQAWDQARSILQSLHAPLHYVPGNHDVHRQDLDRYRKVFGKDYYNFAVKGVEFVVIDSQLLGNYDVYATKTPELLPPETEEESERMFAWLAGLHTQGAVVVGVQHIPVFRDGEFPDPKPYWVVSEPYRSREMQALKQLGIKDMLVGHWHNGRVFDGEGIKWHVAPATSWLPWGGELGFATHRIDSTGRCAHELCAVAGGGAVR
jgi:3',5'-cyclic AMP phosphodiesterase CpdA